MSRDDEKTELNDMFDNDGDEKEPLLSSYNSSPSPSPEPQSESESESGHPDDAKFTQPPQVSRLKRISLLIFLAILCWLAYSNVLHSKRKPKIIHASRSVLNHWVTLRRLADLYIYNFLHRKQTKKKIFQGLQVSSCSKSCHYWNSRRRSGEIERRTSWTDSTTPGRPTICCKEYEKTKGGQSWWEEKTKFKSKPRAVNQQRK